MAFFVALEFCREASDNLLYLNITSSAPKGVYLRVKKELEVGDWVVFNSDEERLFLKKVVGLAGDIYCRRDTDFQLPSGILVPLKRSSNVPEGCFTTQPGRVLLVNESSEVSFDSRYFGAVDIEKISNVVVPRLVFSQG